MNRRGFLGALGLGASAFAMDPEALLWVPGKKTISIPKSVSQFAFEIPPGALDEINRLTNRYIVPGLIDDIFKSNVWLSNSTGFSFGGGITIQEPLKY